MIRRPTHLWLHLDDGQVVDLAAILRGRVDTRARPRLSARSPLTGAAVPLSLDEIRALERLPSDAWVDEASSGLAPPRVEQLVEAGVLLSDGEGPAAARGRRAAETLRQVPWHPLAALTLATMREERPEVGRDLRFEDLGPASESHFRELVERHGPPPEAFYRHPSADSGVALPPPRTSSELDRLFGGRRTVRAFDIAATLSAQEIGTLLGAVFGCRATSSLAPDVTALRKGSPSGGSLHPIEAFPVLLRADGIEPGVYHYDVAGHTLRKIERVRPAELTDFLRRAGQGQAYVAEAAMVVVLTARYERNLWKYRHSLRSFAVTWMDAAHLSQSFYLTATDLGLGSFLTAAIDAPAIEEALGLDPFAHGAVALCGCGHPAPEGPARGVERRPYSPSPGEAGGGTGTSATAARASSTSGEGDSPQWSRKRR